MCELYPSPQLRYCWTQYLTLILSWAYIITDICCGVHNTLERLVLTFSCQRIRCVFSKLSRKGSMTTAWEKRTCTPPCRAASWSSGRAHPRGDSGIFQLLAWFDLRKSTQFRNSTSQWYLFRQLCTLNNTGQMRPATFHVPHVRVVVFGGCLNSIISLCVSLAVTSTFWCRCNACLMGDIYSHLAGPRSCVARAHGEVHSTYTNCLNDFSNCSTFMKDRARRNHPKSPSNYVLIHVFIVFEIFI